jgi:hypothetical protein
MNQGRRLAAIQNGYDIKYKIVDPPTSILNTPVEVLTNRIETSVALQSAAIQTIEGMTGVVLGPESVAIQSNDMAVILPQQTVSGSESPVQESKSSLYFMIGGICVAVGLVSVGAALLIAKKRRNTRMRLVESTPMGKLEPNAISTSLLPSSQIL